MNPKFFATQEEFRKWLEENYQKANELLVGFYKIGSSKPSMTWPQSVDQALCFGWIDGIRKSIDNESYCIRFTPRKKNSIWSTVNIRKVENLQQLGLMKPEGLHAFSLKTDAKSNIYAYEKKAISLHSTFENQFKTNKIAWEFFEKQAPSYKKRIILWVMSAKQESTRLSRLEKLINFSQQQKRL